MESLLTENPNLKIMKKWVHGNYGSYKSKVPRPGHLDLNDETIEFNEFFRVQCYVFKNGKWKKDKIVYMKAPHDNEGGGAGEVINCSCQLVYTAKIKKD